MNAPASIILCPSFTDVHFHHLHLNNRRVVVKTSFVTIFGTLWLRTRHCFHDCLSPLHCLDAVGTPVYAMSVQRGTTTGANAPLVQ